MNSEASEKTSATWRWLLAVALIEGTLGIAYWHFGTKDGPIGNSAKALFVARTLIFLILAIASRRAPVAALSLAILVYISGALSHLRISFLNPISGDLSILRSWYLLAFACCVILERNRWAQLMGLPMMDLTPIKKNLLVFAGLYAAFLGIGWVGYDLFFTFIQGGRDLLNMTIPEIRTRVMVDCAVSATSASIGTYCLLQALPLLVRWRVTGDLQRAELKRRKGTGNPS